MPENGKAIEIKILVQHYKVALNPLVASDRIV